MGEFEAIVVGAGPGGLATMAALLDTGISRILWVDRSFGGGRLNELYREISSNTKVGIYLDAIHSSATCRRIIDSTPKPNAVTRLEELNSDETCQLELAGDMAMMLINGILEIQGVEKLVDRVEEVHYNKELWKMKASGCSSSSSSSLKQASAPQLHLCTGSQPIHSDLHAQYNHNLIVLDLDECLRASHLPSLLPPDSHSTIAVIGNSHSGILVCRNLYELATFSPSALTSTSSTAPSSISDSSTLPSISESNTSPSTPISTPDSGSGSGSGSPTLTRQLSILNFRRRPNKYAEYRQDGIIWDNTGLKGSTAEWAKINLDNEVESESRPETHTDTGKIEPVLRQVDLGDNESSIYAEHLPKCTHIIYAIGYESSPLPALYLGPPSASRRIDQDIEFDMHSSGFTCDLKDGNENVRVKGLFGAGIAFPEQVKDPQGHVEAAVGLAKFFKFTQRVKGDWAKVG
ncbi:pyridine nucleotide-disulfide oxidoreductase-domain-containing protein [Naematelia encephala]|uniref:Pyridine nucleotide-disulfide oxidoreductase-domain-containing protein n=1 Tax=Naematelia encephala TaxID=71784 RepID=A0A1Y2BMD5_9TREE|nr:pyridine nucleotide-disulfide oxidoreductase-domain-containing protein [Naematelia encephala]